MENSVSCLEALLFASGKPVEANYLADIMEVPLDVITETASKLKEKLNSEDSGIQLIEINNGYQLATKEIYYDKIVKLLDNRPKPSLSQAGMEVLSIIAYNPNITRAEIEKIRGVSSDTALNRLIEYNLIEEAGRIDAPGRPMAFKTTDEFLRLFGYKSIEDLPELPKIIEDDGQIYMDEIAENASSETQNDKTT